MKIYNLLRGKGKTTRLLYISEFKNAPIICDTAMSKKILIEKAKELGLKIPEPVCVSEISSDRLRGNDFYYHNQVLVDDMDTVLRAFIKNALSSDVIAGTITTEEEK